MLAVVLARINMIKLITLLNRPMADEKLNCWFLRPILYTLGGDNFRDIQGHVLLHQVNLFVADVHHIAQGHDEQDDHGGHDGGNVDVEDALEDVGAIDVADSWSSGLTPERAAM